MCFNKCAITTTLWHQLRKLGSGASQGVTGKRGTFIVLQSSEFELNNKDKREQLSLIHTLLD